MRQYVNFGIDVRRVANFDIYSVDVKKPCGGKAGDASGSFELSELKEINSGDGADGNGNLVTRHVKILNDGKDSDYGIILNRPLDKVRAKEVGQKLSSLIFKNDVLERWGECKQLAKDANAALSIRIDLSSAPELGALPWEYLRLPGQGGNFVGLDVDTTIVRYIQTDSAVMPLKVNPPLRILVAASIPLDLPQLDANQEIEKILEGMSKLAQPYVTIEIVRQAATGANELSLGERIKAKLGEARENAQPFHVFHFIGHGVFDLNTRSGALLFEDKDRKGHVIDSEDVGRMLQPYRSDLRLVVLNSCEGARLSKDDTYSSVAAKILQVAEVPAAIAMQFPISDTAAIVFANSLYGKLADGANLEASVDAARLAINDVSDGQAEWATPVLYLRADDSQLIEVRIPRVPRELDAHYDDVLSAFPAYKLVFFLGLNVNAAGRPLYDPWEPKMAIPTTAELGAYLGRRLGLQTAGNSLAGLSQQIRIKKLANLDNLFQAIFGSPQLQKLGTSKLYRILGQMTKAVESRPKPDGVERVKLPNILFVTTTYDSELERVFIANGITDYHVISYDRSKKVFSHRHGESRNASVLLDEKNPPNEYLQSKDGSPIILKLPGEAGAGFAVTEDDFFTFAGTSLNNLLPAHVLEQIRESRHAYLGFDLQNWTIRLLRERMCDGWSELNRDNSNAILFHEIDEANAPFWDRAEVPTQSVRLDDYVEGLEQNVLRRL